MKTIERKRRRLWLPVIAAALLAGLPALAAAYSIMGVGDSITAGKAWTDPDTGAYSHNEHGYFTELDSLLGSDVHVFVGPKTTDDGYYPRPPGTAGFAHAGYPGNKTYDFLPSGGGPMIADLASSYNPDIMLLHVGTNDINNIVQGWASSGYDYNGAANNVFGMLDSIYTKDPGIHVFLAEIIPFGPEYSQYAKGIPYYTANEEVEAFNGKLYADLPGWLAARPGFNVTLVDMYSVFYDGPNIRGDYFADRLHPSDDGYIAMANAWYGAISSTVAAPLPGSLVLLASGLLGLVGLRRKGRGGR